MAKQNDAWAASTLSPHTLMGMINDSRKFTIYDRNAKTRKVMLLYCAIYDYHKVNNVLTDIVEMAKIYIDEINNSETKFVKENYVTKMWHMMSSNLRTKYGIGSNPIRPRWPPGTKDEDLIQDFINQMTSSRIFNPFFSINKVLKNVKIGHITGTKIILDIFETVFADKKLPRIKYDWLRWNDSCVRKMAESIYKENRFYDVPILGDALEDAGCNDNNMLEHLRSPNRHFKGCWAVDKLLGITP